jgi:hypothetical protein
MKGEDKKKKERTKKVCVWEGSRLGMFLSIEDDIWCDVGCCHELCFEMRLTCPNRSFALPAFETMSAFEFSVFFFGRFVDLKFLLSGGCKGRVLSGKWGEFVLCLKCCPFWPVRLLWCFLLFRYNNEEHLCNEGLKCVVVH